MNLSVNGQSKVPPGFRFHPTEEELLQYYLRKKVASEKIDLDVIRDIDLNKLEPWDIQEKCRIGSGPQNDWYFFSHKDKKYPTGTRTNRATTAGFWKATGRDKSICSNNKRIGMRKTLVFYKGRAPHGQKSDWIMHEYRLQDCTLNTLAHDDHHSNNVSRLDNCITEDGWVICRVFKKKNYQKAIESPRVLPTSTDEQQTQLLNFGSKKMLDQIFSCMGKTYYEDEIINNNHEHSTTTNIIPAYSCSTYTENTPCTPPKERTILHNNNNDYSIETSNQYDLPMLTCIGSPTFEQHQEDDDDDPMLTCSGSTPRLSDWMTLDRLIASQLNGQDQDLICSSNSAMFHG